MKHLKLLKLLFRVLPNFLYTLQVAHAGGPMADQIHLRTGMVTSSLGTSVGSEGGAFSVMPSFDAEYERFVSDQKSFLYRGTLALEMATTVTRYLYFGVGQRYYVNSRGSALRAITPDVTVTVQPNFRYYFGWDAGMSQIVVNVLTASLQSFTTAVDLGGVGGAIYQISENIGLEAQMAVSYAYGFSSVPATGMVMKGFGGLTYYY